MGFTLVPEASRFHLWTYRDGLMARLAHDLKIEVSDYRLEVEEESGRLVGGRLRVEISGLVVLGAVKQEALLEDLLSLGDLDEIQNTLRDILSVGGRHDSVCFQVDEWQGGQLAGELELAGVKKRRSFPCQFERDEGALRIRGEARFRQSEFGIKPYSAMLGAIRLRDEVRATWDLKLTKS